jgi:hypothetical protein
VFVLNFQQYASVLFLPMSGQLSALDQFVGNATHSGGNDGKAPVGFFMLYDIANLFYRLGASHGSSAKF